MNKKELPEILTEHAKWLVDPNTGSRADLREAVLRDAVLSGSILCDACFSGARISYRGRHVIVQFQEVGNGAMKQVAEADMICRKTDT